MARLLVRCCAFTTKEYSCEDQCSSGYFKRLHICVHNTMAFTTACTCIHPCEIMIIRSDSIKHMCCKHADQTFLCSAHDLRLDLNLQDLQDILVFQVLL